MELKDIIETEIYIHKRFLSSLLGGALHGLRHYDLGEPQCEEDIFDDVRHYRVRLTLHVEKLGADDIK